MHANHLDLTECVKYACREVCDLDFDRGNRKAVDRGLEHLYFAVRLLESIQRDLEIEAQAQRDAVIDGALAKLCPMPEFPIVQRGA